MEIECKKDPDRKIVCAEKCTKTLSCGHKCKDICGNKCDSNNCKELVLKENKKLACGHNKLWVYCCDKNKGKYCDKKHKILNNIGLKFKTIRLKYLIYLHTFTSIKHNKSIQEINIINTSNIPTNATIIYNL